MVTLPTGPTISCPWLSSPVAVIATYAGLPVAGATVTIFYLGPGAVTTYKSATTNDIGLAQECIKDWVHVEARIQKKGVDFGSGNGVQHIIGGKSGVDRVFSGTFFIVALPPKCTLPQVLNPITGKCETPALPVPLPCGGSISIAEPNWTDLISKPSLPGTIPVPFTITADSGKQIPNSIPIVISVDDSIALYLSGKPGDNSIDILSIIKTKLGVAGLSKEHRISIVAKPVNPKCNIPAQGFMLPRLLPEIIGFPKGIIKIPSVPKPPKIPYPVKISIDGILAGEPPISKEVDPGIHNITAELKGMTNIYRKVSVESGKTLTITDIAFEEILVPCTVWDTTANISLPSILQIPFNINISNANWICKATGEKTPVNATAELLVGSQKFYIPIYSGAGSLSLTQTDIDNIIAGIITTPTPPTPPTTPTGCDKTGRIGEPGNYLVPLSEVQAYLGKCHPGGVAETTTGTWAGSFKIIRGAGGKYPAGTYFWTTTWEDIRRLY